ncbi:MAG: hypothetical protein IJ688_02795 [Treponema sp.]|nr:hypothetical protein [Treponema sp.]
MKRTLMGAGVLLLSVLFTRPLAAQEEEKKNYAGWVDVSAKELEFKSGIVQIRVKPTLGTFCFAVLNDNNKYVPVLSTANEYTSSGFFLKAGKKHYRLLAAKNVAVSVSKITQGLALNYKVAKTADVMLNFEAIRSEAENDVDMIKLTATVKNMGPKTDVFALKAVLDTVLGETFDYHFFGADNTPIKNEALYRSVKDQRWVYSRNSNAVMQILFDGADITNPQIVSLANYATLDQGGWEPDMAVYRSFDTVLAYKNSAVGINWADVRLKPEQSASFVFCIALEADGRIPNGIAYVGGKVQEAEVPEPEAEHEVIAAEKPVEFPKKKEEPAPAPVDQFAVRRDVQFNVNNLSKEQLTLEYVQNLIDRISALEENSSAVNRKEILQLNAELDAILSVLRQQ